MKKKAFNFWGKTFAVALTAAVAGMVMVACSDEDEEEDSKKEDVTKVVEFRPDDSVEKLLEKIAAYANDPTVEKIVNKATGDWSECKADVIVFLNRNVLPDMFKVAKGKGIGDGDFNFVLGEASKVPDDSIGIVKRGFTINANLKK